MLSQQRFSTDFDQLLTLLAASPELLIIQDLDGVCMELVRNPLTRTLPAHYIDAARRLRPAFFVLTNGEHIGSRGVNTLVDNAYGHASHNAYLPGLAAGGVQWQDHFGSVNHPGISHQELDFLSSVPAVMEQALSSILSQPPFALNTADIDAARAVMVLDNPVSPTININGIHTIMNLQHEQLRELQQAVQHTMLQLMDAAQSHGLSDSFFIHYAPNLGSDADGERIKWASANDAGTTDFQFMVKGAIKEVGVLVILNRYYHQVSGHYPLGESFNARSAPREREALLQLAREHFDPAFMPRIIGVGDTVTSQANPAQSDPEHLEDHEHWLRGGSDRGFLTLVQELGRMFDSDNGVLFVDSSGGELNRPRLQQDLLATEPWTAAEGITDSEDPLQLNVVFPGGHQQYVDFFCRLARARSQSEA